MLSSASGSEPRSVAVLVREEQIRLLYEHGSVAFVINGIVALFLVVLIGSHVPRTFLIAWTSFFVVAWALRGLLHVARHLRPDALPPETWLRLFAIGTLLAGATWGVTALWLFPTSVTDRFLVAASIMGLASGAAASLSCVRGIYPLYLVPGFLPVALRFAFESGSGAFMISALSVLYCVGMSLAAGMNYRQITSALSLRFENAELARRLADLATHDSLTGLANRRMLIDRLDVALRRSKRSLENLAILFVDCDGFKAVNDTHGHAAGDEFLKELAAVLLQCVRETDTVARLGGDEFIVLLENVVDRAAVEQVVARMQKRVEPSLSIGIAMCASGAADGDALIRQADQAMYVAKRGGGNRAAFSSEESR